MFILVQMQLPCNWDQQGHEGSASPQEICQQCSAGQPQNQHTATTTYPDSQGSPTYSSICPGMMH